MAQRPKISGFAERILGVESSKGGHPVDKFTDDDAGMVVQIPPSHISPNPDQPRHYFDKEALADLTESVRTRGVLQPIIVRRDKARDGRFILIAGERRWRASKAAGLSKIPALIRSPKDDPAELALIENLQRENLNPIEEAESLQRLKENRLLSDATLAKIIGKSRQAVNESLLLTRLPESIKAECRTSGTYSKSLLLRLVRAPNSEAQLALWQAMKTGTVTVRQARTTTKQAKQPGPKPYQHRYQGKAFSVRVSFRKSRATGDEVRDALREALKDLA
jgi:ParB family chromosome partitioning protein